MAPKESPARLNSARPPENGSVVMELSGRVTREEIAGLCERARVLLVDNEAAVVVCDVEALTHPDAAAVDALARLQVTVRRLGKRMRVRAAGCELEDLVTLMGLRELLQFSRGNGPITDR